MLLLFYFEQRIVKKVHYILTNYQFLNSTDLFLMKYNQIFLLALNAENPLKPNILLRNYFYLYTNSITSVCYKKKVYLKVKTY